jgi:hypothetical protein
MPHRKPIVFPKLADCAYFINSTRHLRNGLSQISDLRANNETICPVSESTLPDPQRARAPVTSWRLQSMPIVS